MDRISLMTLHRQFISPISVTIHWICRLRCWADADNLWPVFWDNMEAIKESLEAHDIEVPFPQRDVHHFFPEGKPEIKG